MSSIAREQQVPAPEAENHDGSNPSAPQQDQGIHGDGADVHDRGLISPEPDAGGAYPSQTPMSGEAPPSGELMGGKAHQPQSPPAGDFHGAQDSQGFGAEVQAPSGETPFDQGAPGQVYSGQAQPSSESGGTMMQQPVDDGGQAAMGHAEAAVPQPAQQVEMPQDQGQPTAPTASPDEDWVPSAAPTAHAPPHEPVTPADVDAKPLPRINIQAFCEDQNTVNLLQQASQDRRLAKTHVSVQMGGLEAAAHYYRNAPTPNLIIIESLSERDAMLMDIDRFASVCDSGTKVIVIGHVNDVLLYRQLLQRGVSEYLVMPFSVSQLMQCLSTLYNDPSSEPLGSILAFVGAKGGVGSSTICHNTAWAISQGIQSDVVIADLDLPFGTAGLDFNQDPVQGIADALVSPERLDDVLLDRLLSRCSDYLSLFAAPGTLDRPYDLTANSCDAVVDVLRKNVPFVAMDVPHLWTEWAQRILVQADRVVVTALPDLANLRNTKNLIDKLRSARPNDLPPVLVLNQFGIPKRPEISVKDFASAVEIEPSAVIEFDAQLFGTAANNGQMIEEVSAKAKAAENFQTLARLLTDKAEPTEESTSILAPLLNKLGRLKSSKSSSAKAGKK